MRINFLSTIVVPDNIKLARYLRSPDLGPKILFFSGGTALKKACSELIQYTHHSIHIITPFDSGGSSAILREAFKMPAIGDVRNRLLSLADRSIQGSPEIFSLFAHRFHPDDNEMELKKEFKRMIEGKHPMVSTIPDPMRKIIRHHLKLFENYMPEGFSFKKASIGNIILTAGYLNNQRRMDTVIFIFSKLVEVRGIVRPVINKYLHLTAELENGDIVVGQHLLTAKEADPIQSKIIKLFISERRQNPKPVMPKIRNKMKALIEEADLICYPIGSFYSSLIANLLPSGVGKAIAKNPCPKVYIPNIKGDPETFGIDINDQIKTLISYLTKDDPDNLSTNHVLNFIIMDLKSGQYNGNVDISFFQNQGIQIIDFPLVSSDSAPFLDEKLFVPVLMSLC